MKKLLICGIAATVFFSAKAQINFGVKAGVNDATYSGSDASGSKSKVGFFAGVAADVNLTSGVHLKPELVYALEGAKEDESIGGTATLNASYLNLPVLVAYQFKSGFFLQTGPQIGYLLSADLKYSGQSASVKDQFKKVDLAWGFGAGYKVASNVAVDLRYNLGLSKVPSDGSKAYNSVFQLGVAYYFH